MYIKNFSLLFFFLTIYYANYILPNVIQKEFVNEKAEVTHSSPRFTFRFIKLHFVNAVDVQKVFEKAIQSYKPSRIQSYRLRLRSQHMQPMPTGIIADPRTNGLFIFGPEDWVDEMEKFICGALDIPCIANCEIQK